MSKTLFSLIPLLLTGSVVYGAIERVDREIPEDESPVFQIDNTALDRSNTHRFTSYADTLDKVTPAVVGVYTSRIVSVNQSARNPMEEFLRRYYGLPAPEQPAQGQDDEERSVPAGVGSGVIVSPNGYILTNNHVVTDSGEEVDEVTVQLTNGSEYDAAIIGRDPNTDVALLKIEPREELKAITMTDSEQLRVGDIVFAVGNPLEVGLTVTQGIVSATGRTDLGILGLGGYENFIQTDASINLGNSGGALVDADGRLIGINTAIISRTGGNIGLGFAIPSNLARNVMDNLIENGTVERGFLGVLPGNLTPDLAESFGMENAEGAIVNQVSEGMPADRAGIQHGDVITKVDGRTIRSAADLRLRISQTPPGTPVDLEVVRDGDMITIPVVLGNLETGMATLLPDSPLEGVTFETVSDALREEFDIPAEVNGLVVSDVTGRSPYNDVLVAGMILVEVNGQPVTSMSALNDALDRRVNRVYTWDRGVYGYIALTVEE